MTRRGGGPARKAAQARRGARKRSRQVFATASRLLSRYDRHRSSIVEQLCIPGPAVPSNASRIARDRLDFCSWEICRPMRMSFTYPKCSYDSYHADPIERFALHDLKIHICYIKFPRVHWDAAHGPSPCAGPTRVAAKGKGRNLASARSRRSTTGETQVQRCATKEIRLPCDIPDRLADLHGSTVNGGGRHGAAASAWPAMKRPVEEIASNSTDRSVSRPDVDAVAHRPVEGPDGPSACELDRSSTACCRTSCREPAERNPTVPNRRDRHETGPDRLVRGSVRGRFRSERVQPWIDFQSPATRAATSITGRRRVVEPPRLHAWRM